MRSGKCKEEYQRDPMADSLEDDAKRLKEVLTPEDLAEFLGISVWTIYAKTSKRNRDNVNIELPPFFRLGKLVRFWRRDLVCWLERRKKVDLTKGEQT